MDSLFQDQGFSLKFIKEAEDPYWSRDYVKFKHMMYVLEKYGSNMEKLEMALLWLEKSGLDDFGLRTSEDFFKVENLLKHPKFYEQPQGNSYLESSRARLWANT